MSARRRNQKKKSSRTPKANAVTSKRRPRKPVRQRGPTRPTVTPAPIVDQPVDEPVVGEPTVEEPRLEEAADEEADGAEPESDGAEPDGAEPEAGAVLWAADDPDAMWWDDVWPFKVETPDEPPPVQPADPITDRPPSPPPRRASARPVVAAEFVPRPIGAAARQPRSDRRRRGWIAAGVAAAACVVAVSGAWLMSDGQSDDQAVLTRADGFAPPDPLPPDTSFVRTRVLPSGDLDVRQWIHTASWVYSVTLSTPVVAGLTPGSVRVTRMFFASDGAPAPVVVPSGSADRPRTFQLPPTRRLYVRYRLSGAVQRSDGSGRRALARITSLDVATSSALVRTTRSVVGATVLTLACTRDAGAAPTPCGTERGGVWSAHLGPGESDTPVMAQLDLR